jgi:secreted PhoX family phosphatase
LALAPGFQSRERSATGAAVPSWHDGMAAFAGPRGSTILVGNHEIGHVEVDGASPSSNPSAFAVSIRASMQTTTATLRAGGGGRSPRSNWEAHS